MDGLKQQSSKCSGFQGVRREVYPLLPLEGMALAISSSGGRAASSSNVIFFLGFANDSSRKFKVYEFEVAAGMAGKPRSCP